MVFTSQTNEHTHTQMIVCYISIVMCVTSELKLTRVIENNNITVVCKLHKLMCSR